MMWMTQMVYELQETWMDKVAWRPQVTLKSYALQIDCSGDLQGLLIIVNVFRFAERGCHMGCQGRFEDYRL